MFHVTVLTLSFIGGFWTDISKCYDGGTTKLIFFKGASATKRFARSRIFRYGCLKIFWAKGKKTREGRTALIKCQCHISPQNNEIFHVKAPQNSFISATSPLCEKSTKKAPSFLGMLTFSVWTNFLKCGNRCACVLFKGCIQVQNRNKQRHTHGTYIRW